MEEVRLKIVAKVAKEEVKEKKKKDRALRIMVNVRIPAYITAYELD